MSSTKALAALQNLPVFAGLSEEECGELAAVSTEVSRPRDTVLFEEGDEGDAMYVLLEGKVNVSIRDGHGGQLLLATLGPGSVFGEMSLFTGDTRSGTVSVVENCRLLSFPTEDFTKLIAAKRTSAFRVVYNLGLVAAHRLHEANTKLLSLMTAVDEAGDEHRRSSELTQLKRKLFFDWKF